MNVIPAADSATAGASAPMAHTTLNVYQETILAVGAILEVYDTDKKYPVYGFGAKVCFYLSNLIYILKTTLVLDFCKH